MDIGSAAFLGLLCVVSVLIYALEPVDKPILSKLALIPDEVTSGQVWRVFTWPLANGLDQQLLWVIISIAVLWYFGQQARRAGRPHPVRLVPGDDHRDPRAGRHRPRPPQAGVHTVQLVVLLTFIAEYPNVRFFFGIPAWVLGAVYVAAEVLQLAGDRAGRESCCSSSSRCSSARSPARAVGMLEAYPWIPKIGMPHRRRSRSQPSTRRGHRAVGRHQHVSRRPERARRAARQDQRHRHELVEQGREGTAQRTEQAPSRQ